jgi:hypothetical protein
MARSRRSNATASDDAQTTLATTKPAAKTRTRRSADEDIALFKAKLAAAEDRKLLEDVKDCIEAQGADKRLLSAFTAMTRLRPWLSAEIYDQIREELGAALRDGHAPVEIASTDNEDDNEEM